MKSSHGGITTPCVPAGLIKVKTNHPLLNSQVVVFWIDKRARKHSVRWDFAYKYDGILMDG